MHTRLCGFDYVCLHIRMCVYIMKKWNWMVETPSRITPCIKTPVRLWQHLWAKSKSWKPVELKKAWVLFKDKRNNVELKRSAVQENQSLLCTCVYPECRGWGEAQTRMCSLYYAEEAESSVAHEAEESTGPDAWGTRKARSVFMSHF